jgi:hypothetical protein
MELKAPIKDIISPREDFCTRAEKSPPFEARDGVFEGLHGLEEAPVGGQQAEQGHDQVHCAQRDDAPAKASDFVLVLTDLGLHEGVADLDELRHRGDRLGVGGGEAPCARRQARDTLQLRAVWIPERANGGQSGLRLGRGLPARLLFELAFDLAQPSLKELQMMHEPSPVLAMALPDHLQMLAHLLGQEPLTADLVEEARVVRAVEEGGESPEQKRYPRLPEEDRHPGLAPQRQQGAERAPGGLLIA